jgi:hypothetical protein
MGRFPRSAAFAVAIALVTSAYTTAAFADDDPMVTKAPASATLPSWPTPAIPQSCEDTHRRDRGSQRDELLYLFRVDVISLPHSPPD